MTTAPDLISQLATLRDLTGEVAAAESLPRKVSALADDAVVDLATIATQLSHAAERIRLVAAGVIGSRSRFSSGHSGLAQSRGHRSAVALIQHVTGSSRTDAVRQLRVGESLFEGVRAGGVHAEGDETDSHIEASKLDGAPEIPGTGQTQLPWHTPLKSALMGGKISSSQHDAIRRGLGEPPKITSYTGDIEINATDVNATDLEAAGIVGVDKSEAPNSVSVGFENIAAHEAWSLAAERLVEISSDTTVEDLGKQARAVRDLLDPEGAEARFFARYEARSFRMWTDSDGHSRGSFVFDDESAAWLRSVIDSALRPRRGGPRFIDPSEKQTEQRLRVDPRTNEQLSHDLVLDILKAGTLADVNSVMGARQAGVRLVQVVNRDDYLAELRARRARAHIKSGAAARSTDADAFGRAAGSSTSGNGATRNDAEARQVPGEHQVGNDAHRSKPVTRLQDSGEIFPLASADQQRCNSGGLTVVVDELGNPLDVGREHRLYTSQQRVALAVRDGGCRWPGCDRPANYCEAHHIDEWDAEGGRTDIDRGILLCRFHHMQLHHRGWRITRDGLAEFRLHPPAGESLPDTSVAGRTVPGFHVKPPDHCAQVNEGEISDSDAPPNMGSRSVSGAKKPSIELRPPLPFTYTWQFTKPPPRRFRVAA